MTDRIELFNQKYGNRKSIISEGTTAPAPVQRYDAGANSIINKVSSKYPIEGSPSPTPSVLTTPPLTSAPTNPVIEEVKPSASVATSFADIASSIKNSAASPQEVTTQPYISKGIDIFKKPSYAEANANFTGENGTEFCLCEDSRCPVYEISYKRAPGYPRQLCQKDLDVYEPTGYITTGERGYLTLILYYKGTNKTKYIQKELDKSIQHGAFKHNMTVDINRVRIVLLHKYDASGNQLTTAAEGLVKFLIVQSLKPKPKLKTQNPRTKQKPKQKQKT